MISFNDRLQLEREFYEWAAKNHVLTDPFTVITWLPRRECGQCKLEWLEAEVDE